MQNGEMVGLLKQLKDETSADFIALAKKGLDRKTNHQDLTKAKTEEIFVLTIATVGALKLERSAKEVAQPRSTRPPPWRDRCNRGSEYGVVAPSYLEHEAVSQEGVKKFDLFMPTVHNTRSITQMMQMNCNDMVSSRNRKQVSRS